MDDAKVRAEACGIEFEIDRAKMSDMDVIEALYGLQKAHDDGSESEMIMSMIPLAHALFGAQQWTDIKQKLREEADSGKPHYLRCVEFTFEALSSASASLRGDAKN